MGEKRIARRDEPCAPPHNLSVSVSVSGSTTGFRHSAGWTHVKGRCKRRMSKNTTSRGGGRAEASKLEQKLPLPEPLLSDVVGTWAYDTMSRRINEEILQNMVVADNKRDLSEKHLANLQQFAEELKNAAGTKIRPIGDDGGFDVSRWNSILSQYEERTWLDAPWVVTEYYFYRRILEAVGYFSPGPGQGEARGTSPKASHGKDPFESQKDKGLRSSFPALKSLSKLVSQAISSENTKENFIAILLTSLWGNRMDLSIWPADATSDAESTERAKNAMGEVLKNSKKMLLADQSEDVWNAIASKGSPPAGALQMDIIADNAGFELITDLCLADFLATSGLARKVVIHLKAYPVFVSDAMKKDVLSHISVLAEEEEVPQDMRKIASRWDNLIAEGKWELKEHPFWTLPLAFWEMPEDLIQHFSSSRMVFVKGDANYRRQIGERHWPFATPFQDISSYWPTNVCCLRTMKSEVACGVPKARQKQAENEDPQWLVSGRYGVVQAKIN